jgi:hypothetical protein
MARLCVCTWFDVHSQFVGTLTFFFSGGMKRDRGVRSLARVRVLVENTTRGRATRETLGRLREPFDGAGSAEVVFALGHDGVGEWLATDQAA